ncbi:hypothetical protein [Halopiger goleimassiliensis]|uniref:hypothetical protein n=1 Tax=Halopiger goleimassiliensis TaxID=1293048 RepID=UPI000677F714|nr:hypothetical protein [Halopiger goleimassiliensis]
MSPSLPRPSTAGIGAGFVGGLVNAAVVIGLYVRGDYPLLESTSGTAVLALTAFCIGFVPLVVSRDTGLISPAAGFLAVLSGTIWLEVTSPDPRWGQLNEYVIVDGPTHVSSYANTWYVWLALTALVAAVEFGLRRRYAVGVDRLRNLPKGPLSRVDRLEIVLGAATLLAVAATVLVVRAGIRPPAAAGIVFAFTFASTAIPLWALFEDGAIAPLALFVALVAYFLVYEVFVSTDSPVHILLFGPYAVVFAVVWLLERSLRRRFDAVRRGHA